MAWLQKKAWLKPEATRGRLYEANQTLIPSQWNTFGAHRNIRIHSLWSQACTCTCRTLVCSGSLRGGCTCGCLSHTRPGLEAQKAICTCSNRHKLLPPSDLVDLTYTVIFAVNILQVVTVLTLAEVAAKGVHTLSVVRAEVLSSYTFINIW